MFMFAILSSSNLLPMLCVFCTTCTYRRDERSRH
jgi:hypothetical protein